MSNIIRVSSIPKRQRPTFDVWVSKIDVHDVYSICRVGVHETEREAERDISAWMRDGSPSDRERLTDIEDGHSVALPDTVTYQGKRYRVALIPVKERKYDA